MNGGSQEKMLLQIDSGKVTVHTVKLKDQIDLLSAECDI